VKRLSRLGIVGLLAVALFLVGSLGLLLRPEPEPVLSRGQVPGAGAFLTPGGKGSLTGSIAALQERVRDAPDDWRASASLGLAYVQQGRITADPSYYPKAEGTLRLSLDAEPNNTEALLGLAALALARHDFDRALDYGKRARDKDPYDANMHGVVGDALLELGRYDEAFDSYQTMVDTRPDTASLSRASYAFEIRGDRKAAIAAMRSARDFAGSPPDAAWTSYQLGELYLAEGRVRKAAAAFRHGIRIDPTSIGSLAGLATVELARGDLDGAIARMQEVVGRFPAPEYVIALGDLHTLAGDRDAAAQQYDLARVEAELFRDAGVNVDLELALFFASHGDPREALAAAEAEWAKRKSIHVADALAWSLHVNGRDHEAARYARRAVSLGTKEGLFLYHAGMIEIGRGNREAARRYLREALDADPWFSILGVPEARRALARLEGGR
jgi:tetratricopeptide (TPR) repeat protein